MASLITTNIFDEIKISEYVEITFYSLLGDIKHCCKTRSIYRDIYRITFYDMINPYLSFSELR